MELSAVDTSPGAHEGITILLLLGICSRLTPCLAPLPEYHFLMSVEEIKKGLIALSEAEQSEVTAFLFHLRHSHDPDYQDVVSARLSDSNSSHWVTSEEFEKQLNQAVMVVDVRRADR
jgi:hypothetical protein